MPQPLLLVTNDDGYDAEGIRALASALESIGEVWIVAPESQQSATSHSLTLHKPLRMTEHRPRHISVSGTPTDCVLLGVREFLPRAPDIVVSGINHGPNVGDDVSYSGTVSAALEAAILGLPAVAVSRYNGERAMSMADAAVIARAMVARTMSYHLPKRAYLNVNIPALPLAEVRGVQVTDLGVRHYSETIVRNDDPRGRPYFWIGGDTPTHVDIPGTDCTAVDRGWVSVTPLTAKWSLSGEIGGLKDGGFEAVRWDD